MGDGNKASTAFEVLRGHAERQPERVSLRLLFPGKEDVVITYRALAESAAGYARSLQAAGIQPGEVVILILPHGLDLIAAFWGAVLHGAIPSMMPFLTEKLLPERYRRDLSALVSITRPSAVITYPDFAEEVKQAADAAGPDGEGGPVRRVLLNTEVQPGANFHFDQFGGYGRGPEDIVFLQHSSGTTGLQKGVAISNRALLNQLRNYRAAIRLNAEDVIVSWLPLYHDMGLIAGFLMPILAGVPLVLMSPFDWVKAPYRLIQAVSKYGGTLSWLPNFAYNFCAQKIRDTQMEGVDLSTWRAVINCSEPMYVHSFEQFAARFAPYGFRKEALATSYAMAENVFGVTQGGIDGPVTVDEVDLASLQGQGVARPAADGQHSARMLSCGPPIPGTNVRVIDPAGNTLEERQVGELVVQSDCMLAGYYNRPDATAEAFVDGWYRTGDLGYIANGEVYVTGRKKDLIITGGRNVFPQDIEAAAGEVPGVHPGRVVAFGVYNDDLGTEDVALVAEVDLSEEELADDETRQNLEDAVRLAVNRGTAVSLRHVRLVGPHWMIKTSSGKVARAANREKFLAEQG